MKNGKIRLNCVVDKRIYNEFMREARKEGRNVSEVIRELMSRYIRTSRLKEIINYKPDKLGEIVEIIKKIE